MRVSLAVVLLFVTLSAAPAGAQPTPQGPDETTTRDSDETARQDLERTVTRALWTFRDFQKDDRMTWFRANLRYAKGLLIVPAMYKGGFFVGGYTGHGVLLAQDRDGNWSQPAFYDLLAGSIGFQFGFATGQVILMIMTDAGLRRFLDDKLHLGADASIGVGPEGIGAKAEVFDIFSFARLKGLFGGLSVEGGGVIVNRSRNETYYGQPGVLPADILFSGKFRNDQADSLVQTLTETAR